MVRDGLSETRSDRERGRIAAATDSSMCRARLASAIGLLPAPEDHVIVSGMALGVPDHDAAVNGLVTERVDAGEFVRRYG